MLSRTWVTRRWSVTSKRLRVSPLTADLRPAGTSRSAARTGAGGPSTDAALDGDVRRVVAGEVGGVDDDAVHDAGGAEAHDGPVVAGVRRRRVSQPS